MRRGAMYGEQHHVTEPTTASDSAAGSTLPESSLSGRTQREPLAATRNPTLPAELSGELALRAETL
jgi:hypothetical protein